MNLRGSILSCTSLEKRKYAEALKGNSKPTYENSSLRSSKVKSISFTAQSNFFDQPNNMTVRKMVL